MQLAYMIDERLKEVAEDADWDRALKDVVVATANDKSKATKRKAKDSKKAWALVE